MRRVKPPEPVNATARSRVNWSTYDIFTTALVCAQSDWIPGGPGDDDAAHGKTVKSSRAEHLLLACIDSVEQCEALVTMYQSPDRWWSAKAIAEELYLAESPTARDLELLATRGLLAVRIVNDVLYRLSPASPDMAQAVSELAEAYRTNRVDVLSLIVQRRGRSFKHFAEAFNFRKSRP